MRPSPTRPSKVTNGLWELVDVPYFGMTGPRRKAYSPVFWRELLKRLWGTVCGGPHFSPTKEIFLQLVELLSQTEFRSLGANWIGLHPFKKKWNSSTKPTQGVPKALQLMEAQKRRVLLGKRTRRGWGRTPVHTTAPLPPPLASLKIPECTRLNGFKSITPKGGGEQNFPGYELLGRRESFTPCKRRHQEKGCKSSLLFVKMRNARPFPSPRFLLVASFPLGHVFPGPFFP